MSCINALPSFATIQATASSFKKEGFSLATRVWQAVSDFFSNCWRWVNSKIPPLSEKKIEQPKEIELREIQPKTPSASLPKVSDSSNLASDSSDKKAAPMVIPSWVRGS